MHALVCLYGLPVRAPASLCLALRGRPLLPRSWSRHSSAPAPTPLIPGRRRATTSLDKGLQGPSLP
eukprot:1867197-Pleurochrysis_carterae.AAC.1